MRKNLNSLNNGSNNSFTDLHLDTILNVRGRFRKAPNYWVLALFSVIRNLIAFNWLYYYPFIAFRGEGNSY